MVPHLDLAQHRELVGRDNLGDESHTELDYDLGFFDHETGRVTTAWSWA